MWCTQIYKFVALSGNIQFTALIDKLCRMHSSSRQRVSKTFPIGALHLNKEHILYVDLATNDNGHLGHRLLSSNAVSFSRSLYDLVNKFWVVFNANM